MWLKKVGCFEGTRFYAFSRNMTETLRYVSNCRPLLPLKRLAPLPELKTAIFNLKFGVYIIYI